MTKTVIIGGGITGLATAFYLQQASGANECTLLESSSRWGGKIVSTHEAGFLVEGGPDSFLGQRSEVVDLCRALGLTDELIPIHRPEGAATYVWSKGRLHAMPDGLMLMAPTMLLPLLRSRLISWPGKLRMAIEQFIPKRTRDEDESLAAFVRRRLGGEALAKIAAPLMAGIHAADPEKLSIRSAFPQFPEMERKHGSLSRGVLARKKSPGKGAHAPMFLSLRHGMQQLVDALVARLELASQFDPGSLRLQCLPLTISREGKRYSILLSDGSFLVADEIVFATPAPVTASLVQRLDEELATRLRSIRHVSTATVSLGFRRSDVADRLKGFGFVVAHGERCGVNACSWSSNKFSCRAPDDGLLMRAFVGGALAERLAEQEDAALVALTREELKTVTGIDAEPVLAKVYRWHKANPQQELGHAETIQGIEARLAGLPGLHLAGAGYRGSGIPDCLKSAMKAAQAIAAKTDGHADEMYLDRTMALSR